MKSVSEKKVMKVMKALEQIKSNPEEREIYEREREIQDSIQVAEFLSRIRETKNYEKGLSKGERIGRKKGKIKIEREIIRKMIIEQIPMEKIYKVTELSKKEIEEIRKSI